MTKEQAIQMIQTSDCNNFTVHAYKTKRHLCDLCNEEKEREFVITAKHLGSHGKGGYTFKNNGNQHITKHICNDCFAKLFPDMVDDKVKVR